MELISMTDFVLKNLIANYSDGSSGIRADVGSKCYDVVYYAKFLKQPLTLGMFVPCVEEENILQEPVYTSPTNMYYNEQYFLKYQAAKKRVLFEGFEIIGENELSITLEYKDTWFEYYKEEDLFMCGDAVLCTIEDLTSYSLTLTQTAINQINE